MGKAIELKSTYSHHTNMSNNTRHNRNNDNITTSHISSLPSSGISSAATRKNLKIGSVAEEYAKDLGEGSCLCNEITSYKSYKFAS